MQSFLMQVEHNFSSKLTGKFGKIVFQANRNCE